MLISSLNPKNRYNGFTTPKSRNTNAPSLISKLIQPPPRDAATFSGFFPKRKKKPEIPQEEANKIHYLKQMLLVNEERGGIVKKETLARILRELGTNLVKQSKLEEGCEYLQKAIIAYEEMDTVDLSGAKAKDYLNTLDRTAQVLEQLGKTDKASSMRQKHEQAAQKFPNL